VRSHALGADQSIPMARRPHSTDSVRRASSGRTVSGRPAVARYTASKGCRLTEAHAPGKVILLGEHAVVYGRPAIAVPVADVHASVIVEDVGDPGVTIRAKDIGRTLDVSRAPPDEPLCLTARNTLAHIGLSPQDVHLRLTIRSAIPVASGLGSGAAVATAMVRALSAHLGRPLDAEAVSSLVYRTEEIYHGTPSGIDNTVVAFERPVYFRRGHPIQPFAVERPFWLAIADTGAPSLTKASVADVRAAWQREPARVEGVFDRIAAVVDRARQAIERGDVRELGPLMVHNQQLLRCLDVSSPVLEMLIEAALDAGARGAKLSGGGRGGKVIAAIEPADAERVRRGLVAAGAVNVIVTRVGEGDGGSESTDRGAGS
jgi:mevalonate kinase